MQWDLFCRVVDNFGDVGVGWRLATDLAARGERVRFWLDDQSALGWMAPTGAPGVSVHRWMEAGAVVDAVRPGDVVVEAFGCGLPAVFATRIAAQARPPVWINLEYLSAEAVVERNHGLPSPRPDGPAQGLTQWFFYPGFTDSTGGLLREPDLATRRQQFSSADWLQSVGATPCPTERVVSLFCYDNPGLPDLIETLAAAPTLLLATAGDAAHQVERELGPSLRCGALRALVLPRLTQLDYDHLLWASDLNFVRGEDSFVRAQWAGAPFVWQIYPQHDLAHRAKLDAFLHRFLSHAPRRLALDVRQLFAAWNGLGKVQRLPELFDWRSHCTIWREALLRQADLGTRLQQFAAAKMLK